MIHGGKRVGAGRKKGPRTNWKLKQLNDLHQKYRHSPLDYMLAILNNPAASPERKSWAAEKAAPFVHPKLANSINTIGTDEPIEIDIKWKE